MNWIRDFPMTDWWNGLRIYAIEDDPLDLIRWDLPKQAKGLSYKVKTDSESFSVTMKVPGVKKEDISIKFSDDYLMIAGKTTIGVDEPYNWTERIALGSPGLDIDNATASYEAGILSVRIPKKDTAKEIKIA